MVAVVIHRIIDEEIERRTYLSMARRLLAFEAKERTSSPVYRTIIRDFLNMAIVPEDGKARVVYKLPGKTRPTTDPSKALDAWKKEAQRMGEKAASQRKTRDSRQEAQK